MQTKTSICENSMSQSQISNDSHINPKEILIKCCNRQALDMCTNENCQKQSIFMCRVSNCKCHKEHGLCLKVNLHNMVDSIELKILPQQQIKNFIELRIENIIEELSKLRQELIDQVTTKMKYTQLFQIERRFLKHVYSSQESKQKFSSKDSLLLWRLATIKYQNNFFDDVKELLTKLQKDSLKNILSFSTQLNQLFQKNENEKEKNKQFYIEKQANIKSLTSSSSIIKSVQHSTRLIQFFPQPLKKISLLYKASDHQFDLSKFKEICNKKTDIVILCQSNKGKIVGGYTPLCYDQENLFKGQIRIADPSGKSFMFSLTTNDKFIYENKKSCAIGWDKDKQYIFLGYGQILIRDKANSNNQCQLQFSRSFHNQKYKKDDKDSLEKFSGNQLSLCSINQWQVWKMEM